MTPEPENPSAADRDLLAAVLDAAPFLFVVADPQGRILRVNPRPVTLDDLEGILQAAY